MKITEKEFEEYRQRVKRAKGKTAEVNYRAGGLKMLEIITKDGIWKKAPVIPYYYKEKFLKELKIKKIRR